MAQTATHHQCAHSPGTPTTMHFCPAVAAAIGLKESIIVERLRFWLGRSKHIFGGRPWVYNTYTEWQGQFPFWAVDTVKKLFQKLEHLGVIEGTQRFNFNRWNRTKWYTLNAEALAALTGNSGTADAAAPASEAAARRLWPRGRWVPWMRWHRLPSKGARARRSMGRILPHVLIQEDPQLRSPSARAKASQRKRLASPRLRRQAPR